MSLDAVTLYTRYRRVVFGLAYHLTGHDRDAAEDLTQDTFVRALRHPTIPAGYTEAWLKHICFNLARDRGRHATILHIVSWEAHAAATGREPVDAETPETQVLGAESGAACWALLADLPPDHRRVLALTAQGWSQAAIAQAMGRTPSAIKSLAYRARRMAQTALAAGG